MKSAGIYLITNSVDGKFYVGQAVNLEWRLYQHRYHLRKGDHRNIHLQRAFNLDGEEAFIFEVLEVCSVEWLDSRESYYLNTMRATIHGYNFLSEPRSSKGYKHSAESRRKISESHKTRPKRQPLSEEAKAKMRGPRGPNKATKESYERALEKRKLRGYKPLSEEHKRKISESMKKARAESKTPNEVSHK